MTVRADGREALAELVARWGYALPLEAIRFAGANHLLVAPSVPPLALAWPQVRNPWQMA